MTQKINFITHCALIIVPFFVFVLNTTSLAKVVGTLGQTWPIAEKDLLQLIRDRASKINWNNELSKLKKETIRKIRKYSPPNSISLPSARRNRVYRVDLTYTLPYDIKNIYGDIIYPKGYKFNPLSFFRSRKIIYPYALVIINGNRKAEVEWFKQSFNENPRVRLLITEGPVFDLVTELKRPVFFLTKLLQARLQIQETPSIVAQEGDYMLVRVIGVKEKGKRQDDKVNKNIQKP